MGGVAAIWDDWANSFGVMVAFSDARVQMVSGAESFFGFMFFLALNLRIRKTHCKCGTWGTHLSGSRSRIGSGAALAEFGLLLNLAAEFAGVGDHHDWLGVPPVPRMTMVP